MSCPPRCGLPSIPQQHSVPTRAAGDRPHAKAHGGHGTQDQALLSRRRSIQPELTISVFLPQNGNMEEQKRTSGVCKTTPDDARDQFRPSALSPFFVSSSLPTPSSVFFRHPPSYSPTPLPFSIIPWNTLPASCWLVPAFSRPMKRPQFQLLAPHPHSCHLRTALPKHDSSISAHQIPSSCIQLRPQSEASVCTMQPPPPYVAHPPLGGQAGRAMPTQGLHNQMCCINDSFHCAEMHATQKPGEHDPSTPYSPERKHKRSSESNEQARINRGT